jgi:uncharacterized protein YaaQ
MKLLVSIVNSDDAYPLVDALAQDGHRTTLIGTTGGFLREGNATLLTGVANEDMTQVLDIIKANCRTRKSVVVNPLPSMIQTSPVSAVEIKVGSAVVFILDVERFVRY